MFELKFLTKENIWRSPAMVVVCVISIEYREISFPCVLSNLIKLCHVYGKHLRFADYGGFQILGLLRRNGIQNQYAQEKRFNFIFKNGH